MSGIFSSESRNNNSLFASNATNLQFNPVISLGNTGSTNPYSYQTPTTSVAQPVTNSFKDETGLTANVPLGGLNSFGGSGLAGGLLNNDTGAGISPATSSGGILDTRIALIILMGDK